MLTCSLTDLKTESDVEQKVVYPLLTSGLGFGDGEIFTKSYLAPTDLDKGAGKRVGYYPDYPIWLSGVPVWIIEAKAPSEAVEVGFREAAQYSLELNKRFPDANPVKWIGSCNGHEFWIGEWDNEVPTYKLAFSDLAIGTTQFEALRLELSRDTAAQYCQTVRRQFFSSRWYTPLRIMGGPVRSNRELPMNSFGRDLGPILRRYFDPVTAEDSLEVLEKAYVSTPEITQFDAVLESLLRDRIIEKTAPEVQPLLVERRHAPLVENAIRENVRQDGQLKEPLILIIGGVSAGKTMFLHRLHRYLLPSDIMDATRWAIVDFNHAPDDLKDLEAWICNAVVKDFGPRVNGGEIMSR